MTTQELLKRARDAKVQMAVAGTDAKNAALLRMAEELLNARETILAANALDMADARGKITDVMLDRLGLNGKRIYGMAQGILDVAQLPDPCGRLLSEKKRPNGLLIQKVSVPMGVIAIIYESRPNVTSDAAALAIKAGSACILRCGKEAHRSAQAIVSAMKSGLVSAGLPEDALLLVEDTSRASSVELMEARGYIDLLIPRGGAGLIRACVDNAKVPVLETGTGICHIYVDSYGNIETPLSIIENAKCQRPSVCNAMETCLVRRDVAGEFLPALKQRLVDDRAARGLPPVELHLDAAAASVIDGVPAAASDFDTEYLDYKMSVAVVEDVRAACEHIARHSTHHSESILTASAETAAYFTAHVDSAAVYVNASTRFTDGGEFGLGCEMGISTQKMHARGPMGLEELCSYKYIILGDGQIR